jgi:hypothetical protein
MNYPILQIICSCLSTILITTYFIKTQKFIVETNRFRTEERAGWIEIYRKMDAGRVELVKYLNRIKEENTKCGCHKTECRFFDGKDSE